MRFFSGNESSSHEKDKQENMFTSTMSDAAYNGCNQLIQDIVDLSSAAISPPLTEMDISELGDNEGIDLNKTPQQKTPEIAEVLGNTINVQAENNQADETGFYYLNFHPQATRLSTRINISRLSETHDRNKVPSDFPPASVKDDSRKIAMGEPPSSRGRLPCMERNGSAVAAYNENRGVKRSYSFKCREDLAQRTYKDKSITDQSSNLKCPQTRDRSRVPEEFLPTAVKDDSRKVATEGRTTVYPNTYVSLASGRTLNYDFEGDICKKLKSRSSKSMPAKHFMQNLHWPKVILEGKPERTPKAQTPTKTNSVNPSGKRKYMTDATDAATIPAADSPAKSCRRTFDFDGLVNSKNGEVQGNTINVQVENNQVDGTGFYLNFDPQAKRLSTGSNSSTHKPTQEKNQNRYSGEKQQVQSMFNLTHSINQMVDGNGQFPERWFPGAKPTTFGNNAVNVTARKLNSDTSFIQRADSDISNHPQYHQGDNRRLNQANGPTIDIETTDLPSRQITPRAVARDIAYYSGNGGYRGQYLNAMQQAGPSSKDQECLLREFNRSFIQANGPTINLETKVLLSQQSTPRMVGRDIADYNGNVGYKSPHLYATQHASQSFKTQEDSSCLHQGIYEDHNRKDPISSSGCSDMERNGSTVAAYNEPRGVKRSYLSTTQRRTLSFNCWEDLDHGTYKDKSITDQSSSLKCPQTRDRSRVPKEFLPTAVKDDSRKVATEGRTTVDPITFVSLANGRISNYHFEGDTAKKLKSGSSSSMPAKHFMQSQLPPALPRVLSTSGYKQGNETFPSTTSLTLKNMASTSLNLSQPYTDKVLQQEHKGTVIGNQQSANSQRTWRKTGKTTRNCVYN